MSDLKLTSIEHNLFFWRYKYLDDAADNAKIIWKLFAFIPVWVSWGKYVGKYAK